MAKSLHVQTRGDDLEQRLFGLLADLRTIVTPGLRDEVVELISLGCYTLALTGLCRILLAQGRPIPSASWSEIAALADSLGLERSHGVVHSLRELVWPPPGEGPRLALER